jgi:hypothetical protein
MATNLKHWLIPPEIYSKLNKEFGFDMDPCPCPATKDACEIDWGKCNWVNPPFRKIDAINGHGPTAIARKAIEEQKKGKTSVLIMPVVSYVDMLVASGAEVRAMGRVHWISAVDGSRMASPGTCCLFILRPRARD